MLLQCAVEQRAKGLRRGEGRAGKDLPEGWVIDENGKTRTDTAQVLIDLTKGKAALTPLGGLGELTGGYKGFGYATVVEILSTALQDNDYMKMLNGVDENGKPKPILLGHFFIAIDPSKMNMQEITDRLVSEITEDVKSSIPEKEGGVVYYPGEIEWNTRNDNLKNGIPVIAEVWNKIRSL